MGKIKIKGNFKVWLNRKQEGLQQNLKDLTRLLSVIIW